MSAFSFSNAKLSIGGVDMSQYLQSANVTMAPTTTNFTYDQIRSLYGFETTEPAKLSDCPHKPGTIEHRDWIREHVLERQTDPHTEAYKAERERISNLISDRRVQMDTDRARRTAELDAMIADLPEPNVPIPRDPPSYLTGITGFAVDRVWGSPLDMSHHAVTVDQLTAAFEKMNAALASPGITEAAADAFVPASRHAKGKRRRSPHWVEGRCHHGNPRNACRDCSMGRF